MLDRALLHKRLLFVTGKGGAGKSTVAAALGIAAARRGRRAIVAEISAGEHAGRDRLREVEVEPGLFTISIDPQHAMEEYLHLQAGRLGGVLGASPAFQYLAAAAPGLRELVTVGKLWELAQPRRQTAGGASYDLVIVDAPSSGHTIALLRTPETYAGIARAGPVAAQAKAIHSTLADRRTTGVVVVALPEEMSVNETLATRDELRRAPGIALDGVVANRVYPARFSDSAARRLSNTLDSVDGLQAKTAVRAALSEHARRRFQQVELDRLARASGQPVELPFVFSSTVSGTTLERFAAILSGDL